MSVLLLTDPNSAIAGNFSALTLNAPPLPVEPGSALSDVLLSAPQALDLSANETVSATTLTLRTGNESGQYYSLFASNGNGGGLQDSTIQLFSYNNTAQSIAQVVKIVPQTDTLPVNTTVYGTLNVSNGVETGQVYDSVINRPSGTLGTPVSIGSANHAYSVTPIPYTVPKTGWYLLNTHFTISGSGSVLNGMLQLELFDNSQTPSVKAYGGGQLFYFFYDEVNEFRQNYVQLDESQIIVPNLALVGTAVDMGSLGGMTFTLTPVA